MIPDDERPTAANLARAWDAAHGGNSLVPTYWKILLHIWLMDHPAIRWMLKATYTVVLTAFVLFCYWLALASLHLAYHAIG